MKNQQNMINGKQIIRKPMTADEFNDLIFEIIGLDTTDEGIVIDADEKEVRVNINYAFDGVISREELTNTDDSPLEVVKPGDEIDVYVLSPNDGEGYVQLSRVRALQITEREELEEAYKNNKTIKVVVKEERKVIKETRYCKVYKAVSILMIIISLKIRMVKL